MNFDTTNDPRSIDFDYKKYSLNHVDEWIHDALNCDNTTPEEIYDAIVKCIQESVDYHAKMRDKGLKVLSLFKTSGGKTVTSGASGHDKNGPWYSPEAQGSWGNVREYELKEREFERKRAMLDAQSTNFPDYTEL